MSERNPEATCATCPYFERRDIYNHGSCRLTYDAPDKFRSPASYCGEHPDFFGTETFPGCQCKDCKA